MANTQKKILIVTAITYNLLLLAYFKYANFFVGQLDCVFKWWQIAPITWQEVILPIGISFFTFHKISYLV